MKNYYYENIPANTAKKRLTKLIELNRKNWDMFDLFDKKENPTKVEKELAEKYLTQACSTNEVLRVMGISEYRW